MQNPELKLYPVGYDFSSCEKEDTFTPAKTPKGYVGGASCTSFIRIDERLNADWVYRFNQNPNDFEPESGAYIPKPPLPDEDIYAITAYMMTLH